MSENKQSLNNIYDEKYEHDSQELTERLFRTDRLFLLDGFLLKRYIDAAKKVLGVAELDSLPQNRSYYIDRNGYSYEIAEFLNNPNYLFMPPSTYYSFVVSPEQESSKTLSAPFSFLDESLTLAYKKYREIIKFITKDDVAIISFKFNIRDLNDVSKIHRLKNTIMSIDTLNERVGDIAMLQKMCEELKQDDNILSDAYIEQMMALVKKTGPGVKNILSKVYVDRLPFTFQSFYIQYPQSIISLYDANNSNTLIFHSSVDFKLCEDAPGYYSVLLTAENVIDNLEKLKFIDYHLNPGYVLEKAELLEDLFLLDNGYDVNRLSKFELERAKSKLSTETPEIINALHEIKNYLEQPKVNVKRALESYLPAVKFMLAYARSEFNIVNKLLCLYDWPGYIRRYYSDNSALEHEIGKMPSAKKYYVLKYLSNELRRSESQND